MRPTTHSILLVLLILLPGIVLASCSAFAPPQAFANSTPFQPAATSTPLPTTPRPRPPTATPIVFELLPTSTSIPTRTPLPTADTYAFGPDNFPAQVNPLTGLEAADPGLLNRRPMAIKVTNFPRSVRPQWGLALADQVWEYYIGDAMSRFVAIFYGSDATRVGPIRSARFFDEHLVRMFKSIFVFGSADERVLNPWLESDLRNFLVIERPSNCPPLCRIGSENNYNTLFVDTQKLTQYINDRGTNNDRQNLNGLRFEQALPFGGQAGQGLSIRFSLVSYHQWAYDPAGGRYLRFQETQDENNGQAAFQPLNDSQTGGQVGADNVVVLLIPHEYFVHTDTTEMVKMNFLGQGQGLAFRQGQVYPVLWQRAAQESMLSLTSPDGRPYPMKPGTTWFEVIGSSSTVDQWADGAWGFRFAIP